MLNNPRLKYPCYIVWFNYILTKFTVCVLVEGFLYFLWYMIAARVCICSISCA